MSLGVGTLNTNRKQDPAGPPFASNSAENGASVDPVTGRIVLGNDVGSIAQLAVLLSDREIPLGLFTVRFLDTLAGFLRLSANEIFIERDFSQGRAVVDMADPVTGARAQYAMDGALFNILVDFPTAHGELLIDDSGRVIFDGSFPASVGHCIQLGQPGGLTGTGGTQLFRQVSVETASRVLGTGLSYYIFVNTGAGAAITLTLPPAVAGVVMEFYIADADGITVQAQAGETIRIGNAVTAAGGTINSVNIGSYIKLTGVDDSTGFVASSVVGSWLIGTGRRVGEVPFGTLTATAALNFPNTVAQLSADLTIAVAGAADGDVVDLGVPIASQIADTCYTAFVSAPGVVTVRLNNYSAGAADPASGTFRVAVHQF